MTKPSKTMQAAVAAARRRRSQPNRAVELAKKEVDRDNRQGLLECMELGLPGLVDRYGWHSHEVRSAERLIRALTNMK